MRLVNALEWQRPNRGQVFHFLSQTSYILLLMYYIRAAKYWDWYVISLVLAYALNYLGYKFILNKSLQFNITPLVITNSVFIFITGNSIYSYMIAISIAILQRFFIRLDDRPLFNGSAFAVMVMLCLGEGIYVTPVIALADRQAWMPLIVLFGIATSFASNRFIASFSYWFSLAIFLILFDLLGVPYMRLQLGTLFGFFLLVFTFHVITDPQTSPASKKELVIFGVLLALIDTILRAGSIVASNMIAYNIMTACYICYKAKLSPLVKRLSYAVLPAMIVIAGISYGYFPNPGMDSLKYNAFQKGKGQHKGISLPFHYEEKSKQLGLFIVGAYSPNNDNANIANALFNSFPAPIYAVGDLNNDGYFDLMISGSKVPFTIHLNQQGKNFLNVTAKLNIKEDLKNKIVNAIFLDIDNDGRDDVFTVTGFGEERFKLYKNTHEGLIDVSQAYGLETFKNKGKSTSLELLDYDLDGYIDIFIANYPGIEKIGKRIISSSGFKYSAAEKMNLLLKNNSGKSFKDISESLKLAPNEFTHDAGISDLNEDGYPDLYVSNDYGRDKVYFNDKGTKFNDVTFDVLGNIFNRNGMGVEFADLNGSGNQSIYVSNISAGRFRHGMNYFWINNNGQFENKADDFDISKCGYSWGSKFYDPDLNGEQDLLVGAGLRNGKVNAWYQVGAWTAMPNFIKSKKIIMRDFPAQLEIAGNQPKCLFWQNQGKFTDVAEEAGIKDVFNTKTITLLDMNNDANPLIITGNFFQPRLQVYQNIVPKTNNWVGLNLVGTKSNRHGIGAKVYILRNNKYFAHEVYPTNGITTLNDRRVILGLGKANIIPPIKIIWPSGKMHQVDELKINSYNVINEPL